MSWGHSGRSDVSLNYNALDTALHDKAKSKKGPIANRSMLDIHNRYTVQAYRINDQTIALKLHNTEIIHYHLGGLRTLYAGRWIGSQTTRHWFAEAMIWVYGITPNAWSPMQYVLNHSDNCLFYDSMQVDPDGVVVSGHRPVLIRKSNAEAKELRKRLTALGKIYRTFALMHGASSQDFGALYTYKDSLGVVALDPTTHKFDLEVYKQLQTYGYHQRCFSPYQRVQRALAAAYKAEVFRRKLFDITQGEEA